MVGRFTRFPVDKGVSDRHLRVKCTPCMEMTVGASWRYVEQALDLGRLCSARHYRDIDAAQFVAWIRQRGGVAGQLDCSTVGGDAVFP